MPARLSYPYCNDVSGILYIPEVGARVVCQPYYNEMIIIGFCVGDVMSQSYITKKNNFKIVNSRNPGFDAFQKPEETEFGKIIYEDSGIVPGDILLKGVNGNKLKIFNDGSLSLKSNNFNFMYFSPLDNRFYQWCQNKLIRTPGSYHGEFNGITDSSTSSSAYHYTIKRHFVNPVEQHITFQEEYGLVDSLLTAASGNFDNIPNPEVAKGAAATSSSKPVENFAGYNVYKRKIFDFGGRDRTGQTDFFREEIKSDGAYRLKIGSVEIYYKPDGSWSVGSSFGRITCDQSGLTLKDSTYEVSLSTLMTYLISHNHMDVAPGVSTLPPIASPPVPGTGMGTVYPNIPKIDPNLSWL